MKILPVYFVLITFWTSQVIKFRLSELRGFSLMNICIYLLLIFWGMSSLKKRKFFETNNLNNYVFLMVLVALGSVLVKIILNEIPNLNLVREMLDIKNWINPFIIFFAIYNILDDERQCKQGILALMVFVMLTATPMLMETFKISEFNIIRDVQSGRAAGFAEANQYACFLVLFLPLLLSHFLFEEKRTKKIIFGGCFMIVVMGLVLTGSRGGFLSAVIAFSSYLLLINPLRKEKSVTAVRTFVMLILLFSLAFFVAPQQVKERATKRFNPNNYQDIEEFSNSRIPALRAGMVLFLESPVWGHGHNTFVPLVVKQGIPFNSHNEYLAYLVHYGLIGLFITIMMLAKIFQNMTRHIKNTTEPWNQIIYISYLSGFLGYAFSMLFVNHFSVRILFWVYTAIIYKYSKLAQDTEHLNERVPSSPNYSQRLYALPREKMNEIRQ